MATSLDAKLQCLRHAARGQVIAQCDDSNPDRLKNLEPMLDSNMLQIT
jgi:hypothetical protein